MNVPKISILVASYNNANFFKDCYNSLINQTEKDWEAIVIDDCSSDNSVEVIKSLIQDDYRFKLFVNEENIGYQKTLIKAISLSSSSIFGKLDSDDALKHNAIERSLEYHKKYPEVGLVYSNFIYCNENLVEIRPHFCKQITSLNEDYFNFKGEISHFTTYKKEIYLKTEGINAFIKRAEDKDIYMKMCEVAPVKHLDETLYLYRVHSGGMSTNNNGEKALFWHWAALIKMAERRGLNIEDTFVAHYVPKSKYLQLEDRLRSLKNSRLLKILYKLGIFKAYKYL